MNTKINKINKTGKKAIEAYKAYFNTDIPVEVREYIKDNIMKSENLTNSSVFDKYDLDRFVDVIFRNLRYQKTEKDIADEAFEDLVKWAEENSLPVILQVNYEKKVINAKHMIGKKATELEEEYAIPLSDKNIEIPPDFMNNVILSYTTIYCCDIVKEFFNISDSPIDGICLKLSIPYFSNRGYVNMDFNFEISIEKSYDNEIRDWIIEALRTIMSLK